jgi:hypothetical protein
MPATTFAGRFVAEYASTNKLIPTAATPSDDA